MGGGKISPVRISVSWGDCSQIQAEMSLFEEAAKGKYDYFHLLSGVDLPIKPMKEIGDFFDQHPNMVFMDCVPEEPSHLNRIRYCTNYYHFMEAGTLPFGSKVLSHIGRFLVAVQKSLGISRCDKDGFKMYKGDNWVSLSRDAAEYLLSRKDFIFKRFSYCCCPDEIYKQTVLMNSPFRNSVYQPENPNQRARLRLIDWDRGHPYVWTMADKEEILASGNFFARKFSTKKDEAIVDFLNTL